jgi:hypothetical protein
VLPVSYELCLYRGSLFCLTTKTCLRWLVAGLSAWRPGFCPCDMWWTEWHWDRIFSKCVTPMFHTGLLIGTVIIRRTSGENVGTFKQSSALSVIDEHRTE